MMLLDILKTSFKGALIRIFRTIFIVLIILIVLFIIGYIKQSNNPNIYERRTLYEILFDKK